MTAESSPEVSVIMPVFNGAAYLARAVESVRRQAFPSWELLAVDDCSRDDSVAILDRLAAQEPRLRVLRRPANGGPAAARNTALRAARGRVIAYLDCDDEFYPDYLGQAHAWSARGDVLIFAYDLVEERPGAADADRRTTWDPRRCFERLLTESITVPLGVAHRRDLLDRVGLFDETLFFEEDADLWRRFARVRAAFAFVPGKSGLYHVRGDSQARTRRRPDQLSAAGAREGKAVEPEAMRLDLEDLRLDGPCEGPRLVRLTAGPGRMVLSGVRTRAEATHQIVPLLGRPFVTHLPERDRVVSQEIAQAGFWEFAESLVLLAIVRRGMTVLDAGANLGYYPALLAPHLGETGRIFAFEPEPENYQVLVANALLLRHLGGGVPQLRLYPAALADTRGQAALHLHGHNLGFHSLVAAPADAAGTVAVPTSTVDHLRGLEPAGPAEIPVPIGLLKSDIQGGEFRLLQGAEKTLQADRPILCLEFEPYLCSEAVCVAMVEWLRQRGYSGFRLFHSNCTTAREVLRELGRALTGEQVVAEVTAGRVQPYGTLFSYPDS